ncbi:MAG TPA: hypothetical protein VK024_03455 [Actinomycetaceae bacterium]|nr:hypothetical protein [Actinomycetaceae bacterium]
MTTAGIHGADVAALRQSALTLADGAHHISVISIVITMRLQTLPWRGPDAARFSASWHEEHVPRLQQVSTALREAAQHLAQHAEEQERASGGATGGGELLGKVTTALGTLASLPDLAQFARMVREAGNVDVTDLARAWEQAAPVTEAGARLSKVAGSVGTAVNLVDLHRAIKDGDYHGMFTNGSSLAVTAGVGLKVISAGAGAAVGVSAGVGALAGTAINNAMEGTAYGDRVQDNFEAVFDRFGAAGMLLTPGVLLKSAVDPLVAPRDPGIDPIP